MGPLRLSTRVTRTLRVPKSTPATIVMAKESFEVNAYSLAVKPTPFLRFRAWKFVDKRLCRAAGIATSSCPAAYPSADPSDQRWRLAFLQRAWPMLGSEKQARLGRL